MAFHDPVAIVVAALTAAGVTAATRPPDTRPAELATVKRVGGLRMNQALEHARIAVEFWAQTGPAAAALAATGRAAVWALAVTDDRVMRVREALVFDVPDPATGLPRVRVDFDLHLTAN